MPIVFRCSRCGYVLYVFNPGDYRGIPTFIELVESIVGSNRCPRCGKVLEKPSTDRVVIHVEPRARSGS